MPTRREFLRSSALAAAGIAIGPRLMLRQTGGRWFLSAVPGGTLNLGSIDQFVSPMVIPPAMPRTRVLRKGRRRVDYYEIAVRQFQQQILPAGFPSTTVWSYGSTKKPGTVGQGGTFNYPAFTIEARHRRPVRVKWINDLVDKRGNYLPHLLPVDQTLHWANPPGGKKGRDTRGTDPTPYTGPVPLVTHVHGAHVSDESDGYTEAWFLPDADNIPKGYAKVGSLWKRFSEKFEDLYDKEWEDGYVYSQYPNDQRATTLWYHDHALGMTRLNVYAGPAGFWLIRGGRDDRIWVDSRRERAVLPGPAPKRGDAPGTAYREIPIVIQDRSFNDDGSLFYPDNRAFFEGLERAQLEIPFIPERGCDGLESDVSPIWNPEFFGNTMVVNGVAWPHLDVEPARYRFRFLNGCNSRFLILKNDANLPFWQIGADGGFLETPAQLGELLMAPAERADVIMDFTDMAGQEVVLINVAPDEPFGGGTPGVDFDPADPATTGLVMKFRVKSSVSAPDLSTPPQELRLPRVPRPPAADITRSVSLNEEESKTVRVVTDPDTGAVTLACDDPAAAPFGPSSALMGTLDGDGYGVPKLWADDITEKPKLGDTELWEIFNFTADAHPVHIHLVEFEIVNRQSLVTNAEGETEPPARVVPGTVRDPERWETGLKDTVIAYPGEVTRVKATFDMKGLYVWHCHIVEHEDNEMMRPYEII